MFNPSPQTLGVALITYNEEKNIERCLSSVQWADEIVIVDSGSCDRTLELAEGFGAKVYHQEWLGFGEQKNKALSYCATDWILVLDADEWVSPELKHHIQHLLQHPSNGVYRFKRLSQFCGQWIHHGDWGRDTPTRLFRRGDAEYSNDIIHERLLSSSTPTLLPGILYHHPQESIAASIEKMNTYSNATSATLFKKGKKGHLLSAILHRYWTFFRSFFMRLGFLDGQRGYLIAKLSADGSYFKYVKLWEQQQHD